MSHDRTAEQLRACRDAFEREAEKLDLNLHHDSGGYEDEFTQDAWALWHIAWNANTRADSGEAVAMVGPTFQLLWTRKDNPLAGLKVGDLLFTHPRATAVDARYVTVKHPRFFNEEENNAWHRAIPDVMAAFDAIAAIASREGEGK